jgi:hypothetical protein
MKVTRYIAPVGALLSLAAIATACDSCYGPVNHVEHVRHVKRIQPGAPEATYGPKAPLEWGQINFLHTVRSLADIFASGWKAFAEFRADRVA